jgi:hypothetical protein
MATVHKIITQINSSLVETHPGYSCKTVSWEDASRGTVGGGLSCLGPNITDVRLFAKDGTQLFTVRSDNWNEKIGKVSADEVCVIANSPDGSLVPITLANWLKNAGVYGAYAGVKDGTNLYDPVLDKEISIRFQTTFLPVPDAKYGNVEFAVENYNYQTLDAKNPRNMLLLCTTQGCAFQQDAPGAVKLFHHSYDENEGKTHRYWFECERTKHQVGGAQVETAEEKADALARGKATSSVIGTRAMGTRFNVLMSIQIPIKQVQQRQMSFYSQAKFSGFSFNPFSLLMSPPSSTFSVNECEYDEPMQTSASLDKCVVQCDSLAPMAGSVRLDVKRARKAPGKASAARVSRGTEYDTWSGLTKKDPVRDPTQHITITVVAYNVVAGGIPSVEDVQASVNDLTQLFRSCDWSGRLVDQGADFMKTELTVDAVNKIVTKVATQPYIPQSKGVVNGNVFPKN